MDALFAEIDRSIDRGAVVVDEREAAEGAEWLEKIEEENADELTPSGSPRSRRRPRPRTPWATGTVRRCRWPARPKAKRITLDEDASPTAGRRFTRA